MGKISSRIFTKIMSDRDAKAAAEAAAKAKEVQAANSLRASKEQVAKQAELSASRQAAEGSARDAVTAAPDTPTVALAPDVAVDGGSGSVKKRRAKFGIGTESSGVNI